MSIAEQFTTTKETLGEEGQSFIERTRHASGKLVEQTRAAGESFLKSTKAAGNGFASETRNASTDLITALKSEAKAWQQLLKFPLPESLKTGVLKSHKAPFEGYDDLSAKLVIERLAEASPKEIKAVLGYEKANKARTTVIKAAEQKLD